MPYSTGPVMANKSKWSKCRWEAKAKKEGLTQTMLTTFHSAPQSFHKTSFSLSSPLNMTQIDLTRSESPSPGPCPDPLDTLGVVESGGDRMCPILPLVPVVQKHAAHVMGLPLPFPELLEVKQWHVNSDGGTGMDGCDTDSEDDTIEGDDDNDEVNELMSDVVCVQPKPKVRSWGELCERIDKTLDEQKKRKGMDLPLCQVCDISHQNSDYCADTKESCTSMSFSEVL